MKKLLFPLLGLVLATGAMAQNKPAAKPATKPVGKPTPKTAVAATAPIQLKTALDSLSYAIGVLDASFFKQQGITKLNYDILAKAVQTVIEGKAPVMDPPTCDQTLRTQMQQIAMKKVEPEIAAGAKFLAENKKRDGVKVTATGLQYEVVKLGEGPMPKDTNVVRVHYTGTLINGTKFDSSRDRGEPAEFPLNGVIAGWTEGVQLMPVGSVYKFYIPYTLAYGIQGSPGAIPGGATLVFEVELLDILPGGDNGGGGTPSPSGQ